MILFKNEENGVFFTGLRDRVEMPEIQKPPYRRASRLPSAGGVCPDDQRKKIASLLAPRRSQFFSLFAQFLFFYSLWIMEPASWRRDRVRENNP